MLLSQRQDRALGLAQRVGLYLHLAACAGCRRLGRQLVFMRATFKRYLERDG